MEFTYFAVTDLDVELEVQDLYLFVEETTRLRNVLVSQNEDSFAFQGDSTTDDWSQTEIRLNDSYLGSSSDKVDPHPGLGHAPAIAVLVPLVSILHHMGRGYALS